MEKFKKFTEEEIKEISRLNRYTEAYATLYKGFTNPYYSKRNKIDYKAKSEGKNKGQFGYYLNENVGSLAVILQKLKCKEFLDLGSGPGLMFNILRLYSNPGEYSTNYTGFEIEPRLIKLGKRIYNNIQRQNILRLSPDKLAKYDVIYFWEPFCDRVLSEKFVRGLEKNMRQGQIIIYKQSGCIGEFLDKSAIISKLPVFGRKTKYSFGNYFGGYCFYIKN